LFSAVRPLQLLADRFHPAHKFTLGNARIDRCAWFYLITAGDDFFCFRIGNQRIAALKGIQGAQCIEHTRSFAKGLLLALDKPELGSLQALVTGRDAFVELLQAHLRMVGLLANLQLPDAIFNIIQQVFDMVFEAQFEVIQPL
jgi:hypothetical protein